MGSDGDGDGDGAGDEVDGGKHKSSAPFLPRCLPKPISWIYFLNALLTNLLKPTYINTRLSSELEMMLHRRQCELQKGFPVRLLSLAG